MAKVIAGWLLASLVPVVAAAGDAIQPGDVNGPMAWGSAKSVMNIKHVYLSGQPDQTGLEVAAAHGVEVVVNLRDPSELEWDEQSAADGLGLIYYNVPVSRGSDTFSREAMQRIEAIVGEHRGQKILVHCASGNRAAGWLATHLATQHGLAADEAVAVAREAGMSKVVIESRVRNYLQQPSEAVESEQ